MDEVIALIGESVSLVDEGAALAGDVVILARENVPQYL